MGLGRTPLLEWNDRSSLLISWFVLFLRPKEGKKARRFGVVSVLWPADRKGRRGELAKMLVA
jgi:hypothetical protein